MHLVLSYHHSSSINSNTAFSVVSWILYGRNLLIQRLAGPRCSPDASIFLSHSSVAPQWPVVVAGCYDAVASRPSRYTGRPLPAAVAEMLM